MSLGLAKVDSLHVSCEGSCDTYLPALVEHGTVQEWECYTPDMSLLIVGAKPG